MNEFIVKDEVLSDVIIKNAPTEIYLGMGDLDCHKENEHNFNEIDDVTWCDDKINRTDIKYIREDETRYIGKKDINDKKIYADYSIVEFEYTEFELFKGIQKPKIHKLKGFFKYSEEFLSYMIYVFEKDLGVIEYCRYDDAIINLIKIIDTIQQNKLGLIK